MPYKNQFQNLAIFTKNEIAFVQYVYINVLIQCSFLCKNTWSKFDPFFNEKDFFDMIILRNFVYVRIIEV